MACHSKLIRFASCLLLLIFVAAGCVSLRFDRFSEGTDVPVPASDLKEGKATLTEILDRYGAPTDIIDMDGRFALIYRKSFYRGGQLSIGIPLSDLHFQSGLKMEAIGNLLRHDLLALFFTPDGILTGVQYEQGAGHPFWDTFWK